MNLGPCRGCRKSVRWVRMASGKLNPLDPDPVANGNIIIVSISGNEERARALTKAEKDEVAPGMQERFISHFATCPARDRFKRK